MDRLSELDSAFNEIFAREGALNVVTLCILLDMLPASIYEKIQRLECAALIDTPQADEMPRYYYITRAGKALLNPLVKLIKSKKLVPYENLS